MDTQRDNSDLEALRGHRRRSKRMHLAYSLAVLLLGMSIGFALAQYFIDPITVIPGCGGIEV